MGKLFLGQGRQRLVEGSSVLRELNRKLGLALPSTGRRP